jgi:regulatory protein
MRISKIEKQKKDNRYSIFIDGEFAFGIYRDTVIKFGLRTKDELSKEKINEIEFYDEYYAGKRIALRFLSYRQRSEKEIRDKLRSKNISDINIDKIITTLKELNYINDEQFVRLFIGSSLSKKPIGRRLISIKLLKKGIKKDIIEKVLTENYNEEKELEKLNELLCKYIKKVRAKSEIEKKRKCYQYLMSRGFENELINRVISDNF